MADKYRPFIGKQRGNKLWEGNRMILPEHRTYMLELERKQEMIERPHIDEEKLQEMSRTLSLAIMDSRLVTLTLYTPYELDKRTILPKRIDTSTRTIKGYSALGEKIVTLPMDDVVDIVIDTEDLDENC